MTDLYEILEKLYAVKSPSGFEGDMATLITKILKKAGISCKTTPMGNLIAHKKGVGKKCLLDAHMDTTGFVATFIDEDGFIRGDMLGGLSLCDLHDIPVEFLNGTRGVLSYERKTKFGDRTMASMFIDIGAKDGKDARGKVLPGDGATFCGKPEKLSGTKVRAPYLDNRIGCAILIYTLLNLKECPYDIYAVFSVQEEVGLRGAKSAAFGIEPDFALVIDVTSSCDTPGFDGKGEVKLSRGAAIKVMDRAFIAHPEIVSALCETAKKENIPCQRDVLTDGGTDGGSIHTTKLGVPTGGISVPTRYIHTPCEVCDMSDAENVAQLLIRSLETQAFII
ncbi:MAG: M20/M25/M40 family metallo-hydrolase [Oscillospiraceae bacterium]|nr:M20/M25/M40 family metallo-hydrolase [Oscillospiraceae bacterium]